MRKRPWRIGLPVWEQLHFAKKEINLVHHSVILSVCRREMNQWIHLESLESIELTEQSCHSNLQKKPIVQVIIEFFYYLSEKSFTQQWVKLLWRFPNVCLMVKKSETINSLLWSAPHLFPLSSEPFHWQIHPFFLFHLTHLLTI